MSERDVEPTHPTSIRLPPGVLKALKSMADEEFRSISKQAVKLLTESLQRAGYDTATGEKLTNEA